MLLYTFSRYFSTGKTKKVILLVKNITLALKIKVLLDNSIFGLGGRRVSRFRARLGYSAIGYPDFGLATIRVIWLSGIPNSD